MPNIPIRDITQSGVPSGSSYIVFDDGTMKKGLVSDLADGVRPVASQAEAEAGANNAKTMTALRTKQSIASEVGVTLASKAQGDLANTALQPATIGSTVQAHDTDLDVIAALTPTNDDILQRKAGAWANRSLAQVKTDLALNNVDNTSDATKWAATKTLTNTTYNTAGTGNSFSINGVAVTANTGTGAVVRDTSPTLVTPNLGTPSAITLTSGTGLPINTGVSGLGANVAAFLATPSSANLRAALTDEVGTGSAYFVGGALGTPASATLTNATGLPLAGLAPQAAYTITGNFTGSSASPTASTIAALTQKASPAGSDEVMIADNAAGGQLKRTPVSALGGGGSGVTDVNGITGSVKLYGPPQGRLTLTSGLAVMTSSVTGATTYYYTPSNGNMIAVYDGTNFVPFVFSELSQATTDTTKAPAAVTTNSNYDLYVGLSGGVPALFRSPAWASNTSRGTGAGTAEQVIVGGIRMNAQAITNGPAAQRGIYVGTIRTNGTSTVDFLVGGSASGGVAGSMCVWNMYNRSLSTMIVIDTGVQYTYSSGVTFRQARASAGNQASFVVGSSEDAFNSSYSNRVDTAAVAGSFGQVGIGFDTTSAFTSQRVFIQTPAAALHIGSPYVSYSGYSPLGYHTLCPIEGGDNVNNTAFCGDNKGVFTVQVWN